MLLYFWVTLQIVGNLTLCYFAFASACDFPFILFRFEKGVDLFLVYISIFFLRIHGFLQIYRSKSISNPLTVDF